MCILDAMLHASDYLDHSVLEDHFSPWGQLNVAERGEDFRMPVLPSISSSAVQAVWGTVRQPNSILSSSINFFKHLLD